MTSQQPLSTIPAGPQERRLMVAFAAIAFALLALLLPFAKMPLDALPAFIPLYQSALVITDVLTAALLFGQYRFSRSRAILMLACGYLFTTLLTVAHTLTFPGVFAAQGLVGGAQSTAWLYMFWHLGFPLFVAAYAASDRGRQARGEAPLLIGGTLLAAAVLVLVALNAGALPALLDSGGYTLAQRIVIHVVWFAGIGALVFLWTRRQRTVLDAWVILVMCTWVGDVALSGVMNAARWDVGWYAGRMFGLLAATALLVLLLLENSMLYSRLAALQAEGAALRVKDEFLAVLGHELRNPLAPIRTALQLMHMRDPKALEDERRVIERQVGHLIRLVDDLLDVSRVTKGRVELKCEYVELADIVAKAIELAAPAVEHGQHRLRVSMPSEGPTVYCDVGRMAQVISNLLNNAARYSPSQGEIYISARREEGGAVIRVRDRGRGIPPEMLPHVFEPFVQERQSLERPAGGLGLGLAIVKNLVELHGGTVQAHSDGTGKGAQFVIRLPEAKRPAMPTRSVELASDAPSAPAADMNRVLVVDDNFDARETLASALRIAGFEVQTAHDGPEALRVVKEFLPHMCFIDIGLPAMDGYSLALEIRKIPALANVRLIAITGYAQESDRERARSSGFEEHLSKPADMRRVIALASSHQPHPPPDPLNDTIH
jgi:signal transduction histidine kinase/CheY-like chemotaxis protein